MNALITIFFSTLAVADYTFLLRNKRYPERPFTVELPSTNAAGMRSFEFYLKRGHVLRESNGDPRIGVVTGPLIQKSRGPRHDWDFALDPSELEFADLTIELCDGQFRDIEADPEYWFQTVGIFCPWGTRGLVDEIRRDGKIIYRR